MTNLEAEWAGLRHRPSAVYAFARLRWGESCRGFWLARAEMISLNQRVPRTWHKPASIQKRGGHWDCLRHTRSRSPTRKVPIEGSGLKVRKVCAKRAGEVRPVFMLTHCRCVLAGP